ncbi:cyclic nucleotide-binding and patatin-like phospholipase domain-containing protein [Jiella mangrovi]|uniref:Patatin-like phospholipase family protein n=1 Tax=Jiella mangrovi TaxID=2821407 RepID=A0ABS4BDR3_9HYPH|nr:patatin-like phospholipase family protein [Jiella mangrovi]
MEHGPILADLEIFGSLSPEERSEILSEVEHLRVPRGRYLIRLGEEADVLYFVLRGRFEVLRSGGQLVAEIGAGEPIGEIAFFAGERRTADVRASRDSELLSLSRSAYEAVSARVPAFGQAVLRAFGRRLAAAATTAPALSPRVPGHIGICAAGPTPPPADLVFDLCEKLAATGADVVRRKDVPSGIDIGDEGAFATWMLSRETQCDRLVLLTGDGDPAFDRAALRQSDFLLLLGEGRIAGNGPVPKGELETYALSLFPARNTGLALWRKRAGEAIHSTRDWLADRSVQLHHHLAIDRPADIDRLLRFLTGRALGIVFGGGGALGSGHLGVMRALLEAGATFDMYGGASIGSSVAVEYASGRDRQDFMDHFEAFFLRERALSRLTVPIYSVFDHRHFDAALVRRYGDLALEDCPTSVFAVSTNLSSAKLELHRRGLAWHAIRASSSIPAALPPFVTETGEVLVDGGILDNLPLDVMRSLKPGPNVVIALSVESDWTVETRYDALPPRGTLARQLALRRHDSKDFPRIIETVTRAMTVSSSRVARVMKLSEDVLIEPKSVPGMGILDWRLVREQEAAAYDHAARRLEAAGGFEALLAEARNGCESPDAL